MRERLRQLGKDIDVHSAGTRALDGFPPTSETIEAMREAGVDVSAHRSMTITREMIQYSDLVLVMEPGHKEEVLRIDPQAGAKTFLMKEYGRPTDTITEDLFIRDPIGMPLEEYRNCRNEIEKEMERIAELL
ncbi:MAG: hypothetical protein NC933_02640 [Candidatus Omnitrophica bacterium]|nr:hypothetical protein [Candidatus Omnitrophota bacterium]